MQAGVALVETYREAGIMLRESLRSEAMLEELMVQLVLVLVEVLDVQEAALEGCCGFGS